MDEQILQSFIRAAGSSHQDCLRAGNDQDDYNASQSAALVAVSLISFARAILNLDPAYTEYSAQYLVDNAGKEDEQGEMDQQSCQLTLESCLQYLQEHVLNKKEMDEQSRELTVKDCLQCAFKKGLPRREHWAHLGCIFKAPPFACHIPRVPMRGEVIETKTVGEALKLLMQQPVGARLHLFNPEFDSVGEGIYDGPSGNETSYVGLRDVMIFAVDKIEGETVVTVKMVYKKKNLSVKVSADRMLVSLNGGDESQVTEPTGLLVDFCIPRLSIN